MDCDKIAWPSLCRKLLTVIIGLGVGSVYVGRRVGAQIPGSRVYTEHELSYAPISKNNRVSKKMLV